MESRRPTRGTLLEHEGRDGLWSFTIRWQQGGRRCREVVARDTDYRRGRATAEAELFLRRRDWLTATPDEGQLATVTWQQGVDAFLDWCRLHRERSTVASYEVRLRNWLKCAPEFLSQTTAQQIEQFKEETLATGLAPSTTNMHLAAVRRVWRWFREPARGWVSGDPFEAVAALREKTGRDSPPRILSEIEVAILRERLPSLARDIFEVALRTGLRRGELVHLDGENVDLERRVIEVTAKPGWRVKDKELRRIPLDDVAAQILRRRIEEQGSGPIFPNPRKSGQRYNKHGDSRYLGLGTFMWQRMHKAGVPVGLHVLRATFASYVLKGTGGDLATIQRWMGHSDIATTRRYLSAVPQHEQAAIEAVRFP